MKTECPHCIGGRIEVELGSSLAYRCPDCDGEGYVKEPEETEEPDDKNGDNQTGCVTA